MKQTSKDPLSRKNIIIELRDRKGKLRCPFCHKTLLPINMHHHRSDGYKGYFCKSRCTYITFIHNKLVELNVFGICLINYVGLPTICLEKKPTNAWRGYLDTDFTISVQPKSNIKFGIGKYFSIKENLDALD